MAGSVDIARQFRIQPMADVDPTAAPGRQRHPGRTSLEACLDRLAAGDAGARDDLIAVACERMRAIAHRMLGRYPTVRRYDDTDDVMQNALVRLHRALGSVTPESPDRLLGLAALQIRRELTDLARKHAGPESEAAHHETDSFERHGNRISRVAETVAAAEPAAAVDRWTRLHETAAALPEDERRLFEVAWYLGARQEEAARILGCSLRTVKRRWDRIKQRLQDALPGGPTTSLPD